MVNDTDNLTFSAGIRAYPSWVYADVPKENRGNSVRFHAGVYMLDVYMIYVRVRKENGGKQCL